MPAREVAIVGAYATRQARAIEEKTSMMLTIEAVLGAILDAGLHPSDVDGVAADWPGPGGLAGDAASWTSVLGHPLNYSSGDGFMDNAGVRGMAKAAAAIAMGLCETVVIGGALGGGGGPSLAIPTLTNQFRDPWGAYVAPMFALVAQRHMHEFGTKPEHLAEVAATIRNNGHVNPEAVMYGRGPYTIEDVLSSRMVTSPFHVLDLCLVAQGGGAIVLTTMERARDLKHVPIRIAGAALEFAEAAYLNAPTYRRVGRVGSAAAARAFQLSGVAPTDVDVFSLYDATSFEIIRSFEVLGLCGEGEGGPFIEGGAISLKGRYPTNTDGGLLSHSWNRTQQMTIRIIEIVKQLRRDAGQRQVPEAEVGVVANAGSGAAHWEVAVLTRG